MRLIDFLGTDIRLARALLDTAKVSRNPARKSEIRNTVRRAILSIRHCSEEIEDQNARTEVQEDADRLQEALSAISN
jgi:ribosomal protein S20